MSIQIYICHYPESIAYISINILSFHIFKYTYVLTYVLLRLSIIYLYLSSLSINMCVSFYLSIRPSIYPSIFCISLFIVLLIILFYYILLFASLFCYSCFFTHQNAFSRVPQLAGLERQKMRRLRRGISQGIGPTV